MKTSDRLILSAVTCCIMVFSAYCSQPDNAAVLYKKAAEIYKPDNETRKMLGDLTAGRINVNDKIREFVEENRPVINTLIDASKIENCDWQLDFSKGMEMEMETA